MEITNLRELKELYSNKEKEKWLFLSTGGFMGTHLTLDDIESILRGESEITDPVGGKYWITILLIYPKSAHTDVVITRYGDIAITLEDVQWLRERVRESLLAIEFSQEGNT